MSETGSESVWTRWSSYFAAHARSGQIRVKGALVPNIQMAVFATVSWVLCRELLGHTMPIFAPIVTFVCMGLSRNRQPRKVVEVGLGASTGVLIGGLVANAWGFGWWQLFLLLLTTPLIGRFLDRSELVSFQTAINSVVVASMIVLGTAEGGGGPLDRWLNALVGAGVALVATAILPSSIITRPRRYVAFIIAEIAGTLRRLSKALLDGDAEDIAQLAGQLTSLRESLNDGRQALDSAMETAAISPAGLGSRDVLAEMDRMLDLTERLHVTLSMMQRQARGMVIEVGPMPELANPMWHVADLLEQVSVGVRDWQRPTTARDEALLLASSLDPVELVPDADDWRSTTLMSLLRAVVVDLLELTGLSMAQARAALADSGKYDPRSEPEAGTGPESASGIWGTEHLPIIEPPPESDEPTTQGRNIS